jgi:hypothetical protein
MHGVSVPEPGPFQANAFPGQLATGARPAAAWSGQPGEPLSVAIVAYWQHHVRDDRTFPVAS